MSEIWPQTSDVTCLMSNIWSQLSEVWCHMSDVRCQTSDVWYVWCLKSHVLCQTSNVWHVSCLKSDVWHPISDFWCHTSDFRRLVSNVRRLMSYIWFQTSDVRRLIPYVRCQIPNVTRLISDIVHITQTSAVWYRHLLMSDVWSQTFEVLLFVSTVLGHEVQRRGLKVLFASLLSPPPIAIIYGGMCLYRLTRTIRSFDLLLLFIQNIFPFKPQPNFFYDKLPLTKCRYHQMFKDEPL